MPAHSPDQWKLAELNREIEQLEAELERLEQAQKARAQAARGASHRLRYLRWAKRTRAPAASFEIWPLGLMLVGPLIVAVSLLAAIDLLIGSLSYGLLIFVVGLVLGAAILWALLYRPSNVILPAALDAAESEYRLAQSRLHDLVQRLGAVRNELRQQTDERRQLMASGQVQRAALLQRPWKKMPESEWADFVVEVLRTLGYGIERVAASQPADADLIAEFSGNRIAVAVRSEAQVADSKTIQLALSSRSRHGCERSAVILNKRFTGAAQDFARSHACTVVGPDEFPEFVLGKIAL
jgi:hypothetical protein